MAIDALVRTLDGSYAITSSILLRLYDDWEQRRGGREFPARSDFDPVDLKYVLGSLSLIDVGYEPLRFRIRLHASDNARRVGVDLTGRDLGAHPYEETRKLMHAQCRAVVAERQPVGRIRSGALADSRMWRYQVLMLPLSSDGVMINMIMSALVWKTA